VAFDEKGYTVTRDRAYGRSVVSVRHEGAVLTFGTDVGEEIYTSYGNHSNDFLLVECRHIYTSRTLGMIAETLSQMALFSMKTNGTVFHSTTFSVVVNSMATQRTC